MARASEVNALVERIKPILAGKEPQIQGAVLADLLAIWLAGHHIDGDHDATEKLRWDLLDAHVKGVCALVTPNARIMGTTV